MNSQHPVLTNILSLSNRATWEHTVALADEMIPTWLGTYKVQGLRRIYFVGCGTSWYAGQVGKYALERIAHIPAEAAQAFAFATYAEPKVLGSQALVVGISTTGESEAVVEALRHARSSGAATLAITANAEAAVTRAAEAFVLTGGEDDKVSVKTKSYVQSLVTIYLLAVHLAGARGDGGVDRGVNWRQQIECAAEGVIRFLDQQQPAITQLAERYAVASKVFVLGSGPNGGTAEEGSLKVIEMAKIYSEAQELEDFLHGRFREVDQVNPMFFVAPHGRASMRLLDFLTATAHVDAPSVVLSDYISPGIERLATQAVQMPGDMDELVTPLLYIVPLHLFAYHLALQRGHDPAARRYNIVPQKMRYQD